MSNIETTEKTIEEKKSWRLPIHWCVIGMIIAWLSPLCVPLAITIAFSFEGGTLGFGDFIDSLRTPVMYMCLIVPYIGLAVSAFLCFRGSWKIMLGVVVPLVINFIIATCIIIQTIAFALR
jgi:hypothetical protein